MRDTSSIILYKNNKILLQHRDKNAPTFPNEWGAFGGGREKHETFEECVKRECFEELEYKLKDPQLVGKYQDTKYNVNIYVEEYDGSKLIQHEGDNMQWFRFDEVKELKLSKLFEEIILPAVDYIKNS